MQSHTCVQQLSFFGLVHHGTGAANRLETNSFPSCEGHAVGTVQNMQLSCDSASTVHTRWCAALYRSQRPEQRVSCHHKNFKLSYPLLQRISRYRLHQAASSTTMIPAPIPSNARPKDASRYKDMVVQNEITTAESFESCTACEALLKLFPVLFKTSTSAKKVCRYV